MKFFKLAAAGILAAALSFAQADQQKQQDQQKQKQQNKDGTGGGQKGLPKGSRRALKTAPAPFMNLEQVAASEAAKGNSAV